MPKLYFYDTGLACSLLGIHARNQLAVHYMRGSLFESLIIAELIRERYNRGLEPDCYYWRDKTGNEVDCIVEAAGKLMPVEIKSGKTIAADFFNTLAYWHRITGKSAKNSYLVYGGAEDQKRSLANVVSWRNVSSILQAK